MALWLREGAYAGLDVAMDLGLLAWNAGTSPRLGVLRDAVPDELLLQEGSCRAGGKMSEAMDEVADVTTKLERNPRTRTTGADRREEWCRCL